MRRKENGLLPLLHICTGSDVCARGCARVRRPSFGRRRCQEKPSHVCGSHSLCVRTRDERRVDECESERTERTVRTEPIAEKHRAAQQQREAEDNTRSIKEGRADGEKGDERAGSPPPCSSGRVVSQPVPVS